VNVKNLFRNASSKFFISIKIISSVKVVTSVKIIDSVKGFNHKNLYICIFKNLSHRKAIVAKYFSSITWPLATFRKKLFHIAYPQVILVLMILVSSLYHFQGPKSNIANNNYPLFIKTNLVKTDCILRVKFVKMSITQTVKKKYFQK
jgi:hypothetical protein